ncbi:MAG: hypothetical protein OEZ21_03065 [Candidatus Bathyarchaeota archaeon]|nr:hypothetical protein [Candidatus Bathyarchaeota archaeon]
MIFQAWIELKNYRMMWKELEWRQTYQAVGRILRAEKDLFQRWKAETNCIGCCEIFKVREG